MCLKRDIEEDAAAVIITINQNVLHFIASAASLSRLSVIAASLSRLHVIAASLSRLSVIAAPLICLHVTVALVYHSTAVILDLLGHSEFLDLLVSLGLDPFVIAGSIQLQPRANYAQRELNHEFYINQKENQILLPCEDLIF